MEPESTGGSGSKAWIFVIAALLVIVMIVQGIIPLASRVSLSSFSVNQIAEYLLDNGYYASAAPDGITQDRVLIAGSSNIITDDAEFTYNPTSNNLTISSGVINSDQIYLGEEQLLIPAYAELYLTNPDTIECNVAGTYYIVDGPSSTGDIKGFTDNGFCRLTYTDITNDRICMIGTSVTVSVPVDDTPAVVSMKIYKNGVADEESLVGDYIAVGDVADSLPIMCLIELDPNDYIEVYVSSNSANTTMVLNTMTLVATTVD